MTPWGEPAKEFRSYSCLRRIFYEKNIPAQPYQAETGARLPGPHEQRRRAPDTAPQARQGTQEISGLSFPPERRLTERPDFVRCYEGGRRFFSSNFVLFVNKRADATLSWRLGMAVTRKTGSAVRRNRIRRLVRECFRLAQERVAHGYDYVVVPKRCLVPQAATLASVSGELLPLLRAVAAQGPERPRQSLPARTDNRQHPESEQS